MERAIYRVFWNNLNKDEIILSLLGLSKDTDKKIVRNRILSYIPFDYMESDKFSETELPKLIVLAGVEANEYRPIPFLTEILIEVHSWSKDRTYEVNRKLLNRVREIMEEETFQIDLEEDNVFYWSSFKFNGQTVIPFYVSDLYIMFSEYSIVIAPKNNKKLGN